jgi:O-antigen/teichoic acid export membrane protein
VAGAGLALAAALAAASESTAAVVVAASGLLWALTAEARVRKASALTLGAAREAAGAEVAGAVAFAAGIVAVVAFGGGLGAVAVAMVAKHVVELAVVRRWAERFTAGGASARSGPEWLGQVMTYLVANADYVVLGLLLTPADLSNYAIAFRVASAIPALVATPITQTSFLDLAAAAPAERQAVHDGIRARVVGMGALGALAVLVAAPVLPVVLGDGWSDSAVLVAVLAVAVPFRLLLGMSVAQAIVVGRARSVVGWESARLVVVATATAVAAVLGGLVWATVAVSAATMVSVTFTYVRSARVAGVRPWPPVGPACAAACAAVVGLGIAWG